MKRDISNFRKTYSKNILNEELVSDSPLILFDEWFNEVHSLNDGSETNAMTLSTIDDHGFPKNRVVLLKFYSDNGFIFFTNYNSRKGKNISVNSNVCLSFYWPSMERQVIIQGLTHKISEHDSIEYFNSRPKSSRVGAIISNQSEVIPSRNYIDKKLNNFISNNKELIKPKNWGGFNVVPSSIEFWQGRDNRLHDRIIFFNENKKWVNKRLSP